MKAKIINRGNHWEIHLYNSSDELIDRIYVTDLELPVGATQFREGTHEESKMVGCVA